MQKMRNPVCASFFEVANQAHSVPQFYFRFFRDRGLRLTPEKECGTFQQNGCCSREWGCAVKRESSSARAVVILSCLATCLIFLGNEAPASAQVLYGSIVGTVSDQANAVVPKTAVTVKNKSTGLSRQVNTD